MNGPREKRKHPWFVVRALGGGGVAAEPMNAPG
jgi:hypothetical protein